MPKVRLQDTDEKHAYQPYSEAPDKLEDAGNKMGLQMIKVQLGMNNSGNGPAYNAAVKQPGLEPLLKLLLKDGALKTLSGKPIAEKGVEPKPEDMQKLYAEMEKGNVLFQGKDGTFDHLAMDVAKDGTRTFLFGAINDQYEDLMVAGFQNGLMDKSELKTVLEEKNIDFKKYEKLKGPEKELPIITPPTANTLQETMTKEEAQKELTALGKAPERSFFQFFIDIFQRIVGGKTYDQKLKDYNDTRETLMGIFAPEIKNQKLNLSATMQSRWALNRELRKNLSAGEVLGIHVMNSLGDHLAKTSVNPKILEAVSDPVKFGEMTEKIGLALEKTDAFKQYVQKFERKYPDGISTRALIDDEKMRDILKENDGLVVTTDIEKNVELLLRTRSAEEHELFLQSVEKLIPTSGLDDITKEFHKLLDDYPDLKISETQVTNEPENKVEEAKEPAKKEPKSVKESVIDGLCSYANDEPTAEAPDMLLRKALFLRMVELQPEEKREASLAQMDTALNDGRLFEDEKLSDDDKSLIYTSYHRDTTDKLLQALQVKHDLSREDMQKRFEESIELANAKKEVEKELNGTLPEKLETAQKTLEEEQRILSARAQFRIANNEMNFDTLSNICVLAAAQTYLREMAENKRQPNALFLNALSDREKSQKLLISMENAFYKSPNGKAFSEEYKKAYPQGIITDLQNNAVLKQKTAANLELLDKKNIIVADDFAPLVQSDTPETNRQILDGILSETVGSRMKEVAPNQELLSILDGLCAPKRDVSAGKTQPAPAKPEDSPLYHLWQPVVKDLCKAAKGETILRDADMQLQKALCLKAVELDTKNGSKLLESSLPVMDKALKNKALFANVKLTEADKKTIQEWEKAPEGKDLAGALAKNHGLDNTRLVKTVVDGLSKPTLSTNKAKPETKTTVHETKKDGITTETGPKK